MEMRSSNTSVFRKVVFGTGLAALAAAAGICLGATGMISDPSSNASSNTASSYTETVPVAPLTPTPMKISGSPDEKIDADGTQGSFKPATDGAMNAGPQCNELSSSVACVTSAEEAAPQDKATPH